MNSNQKIFCFFEKFNSEFSTQSRELIEYWSKSWQNQGWHPTTLSEQDIKNHSLYRELKFDKFEDSNIFKYCNLGQPLSYTRTCFMRWLAFFLAVEKEGDIFWADIDVINYSFSSDRINEVPYNRVLAPEYCAGRINLSGGNYLISTLVDIEKGKYNIKEMFEHFSDMFAMSQMVRFNLVQDKDKKRLCHIPKDKNWLEAPLIHYHNGIFNNDIFGPILHIENKRVSRLEAIKILEKLQHK